MTGVANASPGVLWRCHETMTGTPMIRYALSHPLHALAVIAAAIHAFGLLYIGLEFGLIDNPLDEKAVK